MTEMLLHLSTNIDDVPFYAGDYEEETSAVNQVLL